MCPSVLEYDSIVFRTQILTQLSLSTIAAFCMLILPIPFFFFFFIFLFPEIFCSNFVFRTLCCYFCESSLVSQPSFFSFPLTFINSSCCFHSVFPLDGPSRLLSEQSSAFGPKHHSYLLPKFPLPPLLSCSVSPRSGADYQPRWAVFLLTHGWK